MPKKIDKKREYKVVHPLTGNDEVWTGDRIIAYQNTYNAVIDYPARKKSTTKKESTKEIKDADDTATDPKTEK